LAAAGRNFVKMFECNVCQQSFEGAGQLQDHFVDPSHMRTMLVKPEIILRCKICLEDVTSVNFTDHILSRDHRNNLRSLVGAEYLPSGSPASSYDVQNELEVPGSKPSHKSRAKKKKKKKEKDKRSKKYHCPFCIEQNVTDLIEHINKVHPGEYFVCSACSEMAIYMDLLADHIEEKHHDIISEVQVSLPANKMFFSCKRCHVKRTLRGDYVGCCT
jgi:ribosomal protein L37AE/L43A